MNKIKNSVTTPESRARDKFCLPLLRELYEAYPDGRLFNKKTQRFVGAAKKGYGGVGFYHEGIKYFFNTHRVLWLLQKGLIRVGYCLNHKDGDKTNRRLKNLEVTTSTENQEHAFASGLKEAMGHPGDSNPNSSLTDEVVAHLRRKFKAKPFNVRKQAARLSVCRQTLSCALTGKSYTSANKLESPLKSLR